MNNDNDSGKRVIIAVIISIVILFAYPYFLKWISPPKPPAASSGEKPQAQVPAQANASVSVNTVHSKGAPVKSPVQVKEVFSTVETPLWKAVFTNKGGAVRSWELKKFASTLEPGAVPINLSASVMTIGSMDTSVRQADISEDIVFDPSSSEITLAGAETKELVFTGTTAAGLRVEKRYRFDAGAYLANVQLTFENPTKKEIVATAVTTLNADKAGKDATGYHSGPLAYAKDKVLRANEKDPDESGIGAPKWLGMEDKYFLAAIIPAPDTTANWKTHVATDARAVTAFELPISVAPGTVATVNYGIFMGPKEYDLLLSKKNGLEGAIEFGMFAFLAKPSLVVLNFFKRYLVNYGLAIVLFTVILKVVFYPLTKHSLTSMRDMQKIQPQLAYLKEKHKDNKERLNKEMMELYKRYKINPVGGCLPMVLQIPVFIALYEVLYVAIELRHAPLGLWIHDLSSKDPYYITPLVMGATMFIQQKMTPTTADPTQAKIMMFMPIVFTFMFLKFPAGLVIYWLINNLLSIAQQYWIQRTPSKVLS
ncbi:MAG: membrane protein insertase YidC [Deltaproteobacteria bacterium]|nr:membrane protein insertase YidC [Deltaproteobacteria bacterium]